MTNEPHLNGYIAFYKGKQVEVRAETQYKAQLLAAEKFGLRATQAWKVAIMLAEKDGQPVVHDPGELP